jgi:hypothetical protein
LGVPAAGGKCGFDLDLEFDFELTPTTARAEVAKVIAARIGGDALTCPRCRSEIVVDTLTASVNEDAQVARARAAEAMKKGGVRWSVRTADGHRGGCVELKRGWRAQLQTPLDGTWPERLCRRSAFSKPSRSLLKGRSDA